MLSGIRGRLGRLLRPFRRVWLSMGSGQECPMCGWQGREFYTVQYPKKPAVTHICPNCESASRHRLAYTFLKDELPQFAKNTLHFAPETSVTPWLKAISTHYLSVDLTSSAAMKHMDINQLRCDDNEFSLIWCSHVLEHIETDERAMTELFRVLQPGGLAVILVPIYGDVSYEDRDITSAEDRLKHFYQEDHVRLYGLDIVQRLEKIGFDVEVLSVDDLPAEQVEREQLSYPSTKEVFKCVKPK